MSTVKFDAWANRGSGASVSVCLRDLHPTFGVVQMCLPCSIHCFCGGLSSHFPLLFVVYCTAFHILFCGALNSTTSTIIDFEYKLLIRTDARCILLFLFNEFCSVMLLMLRHYFSKFLSALCIISLAPLVLILFFLSYTNWNYIFT